MGNYRFKFSDMIPNSWFRKLNDNSSSRTRNQNITHPTKKKQQQTSSSVAAAAAQPQPPEMQQQQPHLDSQRKSYYFTRDQPAETPRKSSKKRRSTKRNKQSPRVVASSISAGCSCRASVESVWTKPDSTPEDYPNSSFDSSSGNESILPHYGSDLNLIPETFDGKLSWSATCHCRVDSNFVVGLENKPFNAKIDQPRDKLLGFNTVSELDLPPIITKPNKIRDTTMKTTKKIASNEPTKIKRSSAKFEERNAYGSFSVKVVKEDIITTSSKPKKFNPIRKTSSIHSPGLKLRTNSPRIKLHGRKSVSSTSSSSSKKSLTESFAVIKSSKDPRKDFKESMMEMIVENNIFASKDLEDLLACYLSLNSDEYHELIIKVFKQIWFDIIDTRLK